MMRSLREALRSPVHLRIRRITRSITEEKKRREFFLAAHALIGIGLILVMSVLLNSSAKSRSPELLEAAGNMEQSINIIKGYCIQHLINTDNPEDPLHTGLIGPEWSEITTTIGDPEAKRTTINPNFAALIAHFLQDTGVKKGDTIAIGSSASFPALLIASLSAAKALELHPIVIISLGSSSFGSSNPEFNLWDMYSLLLEHQIFETRPAAASFGGEDDSGSEFDPAMTDRIKLSLLEAGIPLISETDLPKNRALRESFYFAGNPGRIRAFINSGGGYANLGSSSSVLNIRPGLVKKAPMPEPAKQGLIHSMLRKEIPVIHLLYIKGLAQQYNLPWDPVSQPPVQPWFRFEHRHNPVSLVISIIGLLWFILMMIRYRMLYNIR